MPIPSLNDETPINQYVATAGQTAFDFTFYIFETSDIKVYVNDILETIITDYNVRKSDGGAIGSGDLPMDGGKIVFNIGLNVGDKVSINRDIPVNRLTSFTSAGPFTAEVVNKELTRILAISQQLKRDIIRSLKLAPSDAEGGELNLPTDRADSILAFDLSNNLIVKKFADIDRTLVSPYMATLLDDTTASQARTTLDAQQLNANLTTLAGLAGVSNLSALAGLTGASNKIPYFTGAGAMALADLLATTTTLGTIQIATNAEAQAYTNSSKAIVPSSLASALNQFAIFEDQKASGTAGGTPTTGARNTRTLNTTITNTITGCSLASNQITLPAGTYFVRGYSMAGAVNGHKLYLRNFSDSSDSLIGMSAFCPLTVGINLMSIIEGIITIASSKVFELQHYIGSNGSGSSGLGYAVTDGNVERYSRILIQKIG